VCRGEEPGVPELRQLGEFLDRYASAAVSIDGAVEHLDVDDRVAFAYAPGKARLQSNGITPYAFHDRYQDAIMRAGGLARARTDIKLMREAVPTSWVPFVASLIADGPDVGGARAHAPGDKSGELDVHMPAELAVMHALFDRRDHFVGIEASLAVREDIAQIPSANHVTNLGLLDAKTRATSAGESIRRLASIVMPSMTTCGTS
jgi:hypothetical protein